MCVNNSQQAFNSGFHCNCHFIESVHILKYKITKGSYLTLWDVIIEGVRYLHHSFNFLKCSLAERELHASMIERLDSKLTM